MHISLNSKLTKADIAWLEQQFDLRGFNPQIARMGLQCHVADFQSAFPQVSSPPYSFSLARASLTIALPETRTACSHPDKS